MDLLKALGLRKGRVETSLKGAGKLLEEEREDRLSNIYPACSRICREVGQTFAEIREDCKLFEGSKAEMDPELRSAVKAITRKMKENFMARMRAVKEPEKPLRSDYAGFEAFSKTLREALESIAKINTDNRYIFTLYKEDAERFKEPFKRAISLSEALEGTLAPKREEAEGFAKAISLISRLEKAKERMEHLEEEERLAEARIGEKRKELAGFKGNELEEKRKELAAASAELASVGGSIAASLTQLERALRKYGKTEPHEKLERYAEAPLEELLREGKEYPKLKEMLKRMMDSMGKWGEGLKNPEKARAQMAWLLAGNLTPLLEKHAELERRKVALEMELEPLQGKERGRQSLEAEVEQLVAGLEKQKKSISEAKAEFEKGKEELKEKFREVVGKELELRD